VRNARGNARAPRKQADGQITRPWPLSRLRSPASRAAAASVSGAASRIPVLRRVVRVHDLGQDAQFSLTYGRTCS
jgi:hypothetical protein